MNISNNELLKYLKNQYGIQFSDIKKVKGTYKLEDALGKKYALKVVKYDYKHFNFILKAIMHLQKSNFYNLPDIIKTKYNEFFIKIDTCFAYLSNWVESRSCNYEDDIELEKAVTTVALMHTKSRGFIVDDSMRPRIGWFSWINVFYTRMNEILDFKNRISQKAVKSEFDMFYLKNMPYQIELAKRSIDGLKKSNYIRVMEKHVRKLEFCHHDLANHNVLINPCNTLYVIDFDYCILDSHIHDLSSLIIRVMKNGNWDNKRCLKIINDYSRIYPVYENELDIMKYFIMFPQEYWQIGLQKYWEQQPYTEEKYESKIKKYIDDQENRDIFLNNFLY